MEGSSKRTKKRFKEIKEKMNEIPAILGIATAFITLIIIGVTNRK